MALQKQVKTKYGVSAEYHKIIETQINWHNKTAMIRVGVFTTEDARRAGCSPIGMRIYTPSDDNGDAFPFNAEDTVPASAYAYLKTLDDFAGAIDA